MRREGDLRQVVWSSFNPPGAEYCRVRRGPRGWTLKGTVARRFEEGTATIVYTIATDLGWETRRVRVEQLLNDNSRVLEIRVARGHWFTKGRRNPELDGCRDVDLGASPATNTLPLKRQKLEVGSRVDLKVAWVRFPSLEVRPLYQSYERLGKYRYRYSSGRFEAEIELDEFGLVRRYGGFWEAV